MKIALFLPYASMTDIAQSAIEKLKIENAYVKLIPTADTVQEARNAVEEGARIIVARGYQATLIREYTNIPLVEMRFHTQELGLLIQSAKKLITKKHPRIGLIVFRNMLSDTSHMEELFDVDLLISYLDHMEDISESLDELAPKKPDIIIGGETVCHEAQQKGFQTLFYTSTEESIQAALQTAKNMAFVMETELQSSAQFETVLDTVFHGIIKINSLSEIIAINRLIEKLLNRKSEEIAGQNIMQVFPSLDSQCVHDILSGNRDVYSSTVRLGDQSWMLMMAPIQYDNQITGAILSLQNFGGGNDRIQTSKKELYLHGFSSSLSFENIKTRNEKMQRVLSSAESFALSDNPILISAKEWSEFYKLAEAIHGNSRRRSRPFISVDLTGTSQDQQLQILFGSHDNTDQGAMRKADNGTILIIGAEFLTLYVQEQLFRLLMPNRLLRTDYVSVPNIDVRMILCTREDLIPKVMQGSFHPQLYYLLEGLLLEIPGISKRPEDLVDCFTQYFEKACQKYHKHLSLTKDAYQAVKTFSWPGSELQVQAFCERLVLDAQKRKIEELVLKKLYYSLYPAAHIDSTTPKAQFYQAPEAAEIQEALARHHGNRSLTAADLGISTTTLWRKIKKYGIEMNFNN